VTGPSNSRGARGRCGETIVGENHAHRLAGSSKSIISEALNWIVDEICGALTDDSIFLLAGILECEAPNSPS
jgi:hypothetical protein